MPGASARTFVIFVRAVTPAVKPSNMHSSRKLLSITKARQMLARCATN
jgi:hypothetical protein